MKVLKTIPIMCDRCGRTLRECVSKAECIRFLLERGEAIAYGKPLPSSPAPSPAVRG
jgi:hypothetical protein